MSAAETDLRGRKKVRVRLRRNLVFVPQQDGDRGAVVLKDPVSLHYYRLDARQRFAVELMDGTRTLDEIQVAYERAHRPERLPLEELEAFATQLLASGLAQAESPLAGGLLYEQAETQRRRALHARLLQILWLRIPLCDPDRFLARVLPFVRFLFTVRFALVALALAAAAGGLVLTHWDGVLRRLPDRHALFSPRTVVYLWLALGLAKVVHELGHGLCCKALGGEVHEMGLMLLLLFPALYCNTSDAWKLPRKWQRMAVSAAGVYAELLLATAAAFGWWLTDPSGTPHGLCFGLMVACGVNTVLFNANPLVRCDGYYLLSDWVDVPNLAELSGQALRAAGLRWLGVPTAPDAALPVERTAFAVGYAVASWAYRGTALAVTLYFLHQWLQPHKLGVLALLIAAGAVGTMFVWPACRFVAALAKQRSFRDMKAVRVWLSLAALAAVGVVVLAVPLPVYVEGVAVIEVEPGQVARVTAPECGGFLVRLAVHDGQSVQEGEVLAVLTNPAQDVALRLNEADQALRLRQRQDLVAYLAGAGAAAATSADPAQADFELEALRQQQATLTSQQARLTLRAPRSGVVMGLRGREDVGKWLEGGAELCRVGNPRALRAVFVAAPGDRQLIRAGGKAHVRVHGGGARSWTGTVSAVAQVEAGQIPPQLASGAGGDVPTRQDPGSLQEKPRDPCYLVAVAFAGGDRTAHPGVMGRVRVEVGSQTLWWRCRRFLGNTFSWGL